MGKGLIDQLVNKLEYKNYNIDPPSLDYPMYLDPPSLNYQRASPSLTSLPFQILQLSPIASTIEWHNPMLPKNSKATHNTQNGCGLSLG